MKLWRWKSLYLALLVAGDAAVIYLSFWLAYQIRFHFNPFLEYFPVIKGIPAWRLYHEALLTVVPAWLFIFAFWSKLYRVRFIHAADAFLSLAKSVSTATLLVVAITFLYRRYEYSRLVLGLAWAISLSGLFLYRELLKSLARAVYDKLAQAENVVLLSKGKIAETVSRLIQRDPHRNLIVYNDSEIDKLKKDIASGLQFREIVVQGQFLNNETLQGILDDCEEREIEIKILPDFLEMRLGEILVDDSLGLPVLHLKPLSLHGHRFWIKRVFDVGVAIVIVSVLFIPFVLISLAILLDSKGGIFFYQERVGFKEKRFRCLKFRTMRQDAEKVLEEMNLPSFRGGPAFKMKDDPRVTRVGKWLRKFSFDEFPQIWNVLRGEMSLIGPRPQVLAEASGNPDWARKRYHILPGITGLWQVSGRADLSYEDMMRLDIYYLENWSPGLDLRILLKTLPVVLFSKGAY